MHPTLPSEKYLVKHFLKISRLNILTRQKKIFKWISWFWRLWTYVCICATMYR